MTRSPLMHVPVYDHVSFQTPYITKELIDITQFEDPGPNLYLVWLLFLAQTGTFRLIVLGSRGESQRHRSYHVK